MSPVSQEPCGMFRGLRVYSDSSMVEQYRFPRSRKKRVQLKWRKNSRNYRPMTYFLHDKRRGSVYGHPTLVQELRRQAQPAAYSMGAYSHY